MRHGLFLPRLFELQLLAADFIVGSDFIETVQLRKEKGGASLPAAGLIVKLQIRTGLPSRFLRGTYGERVQLVAPLQRIAAKNVRILPLQAADAFPKTEPEPF